MVLLHSASQSLIMDIVLLLDDTPHMAFTSVSTAPVSPPTGADETTAQRLQEHERAQTNTNLEFSS